MYPLPEPDPELDPNPELEPNPDVCTPYITAESIVTGERTSELSICHAVF
jgi:hypothetical protein